MRERVLGTGVIGVTVACCLQCLGCAVIDRQPLPAAETSFANGGKLPASHVEPWANPGRLNRLLRAAYPAADRRRHRHRH